MSKFYEINGIKYLLGTAGSLILACPQCGEEYFRNPSDYVWTNEQMEANPALKMRGLGKHEFDICFACKTRMEPIRLDELESRWKPFWKSLGHEVS